MRQFAQFPFMSVVVISYNGSATIGRALESLLEQDYPQDRYEIIVVDDSSTDNTADIVKSFDGVRYVHFARDKTLATSRTAGAGIAAVRNAGMEIARGDVYVAFDDDIVADRSWLSQLAEGYKLDSPAGVGGFLADDGARKSILKKYILASGAGPAPAGKPLSSRTILTRLANYVASGWHKLDNALQPAHVVVQELYGANGSYPLNVLRAVGGWRKDMSGIEDRDLSLRIKQMFPERSFYAMRDAKIVDDPDTSLKRYFLRPYKRGVVNFQFHKMNKLLPPLFPYPVLYLCVIILAAFINVRVGIVAALVLPQVLYFWWLVSLIKTRQLIRIVFPYMQLAEEAMVLVGIIRGVYVVYSRERRA